MLKDFKVYAADPSSGKKNKTTSNLLKLKSANYKNYKFKTRRSNCRHESVCALSAVNNEIDGSVLDGIGPLILIYIQKTQSWRIGARDEASSRSILLN